mgnify:CR=1 FL=1
MAESLRNKTINGMIWSSFGKFGALILQFVSNLVLARLLLPSDFGAIGLLYVFTNLSAIVINGGFGSALIQKKNPTDLDYTSVFWWNFVSAIIIYAVLFCSAPAIGRFYQMPELVAVLRVQSITLIILAFSMVQSTQLQKNLRFRELSIRSIISTLVGTVVAIIMAFLGFGIWSLVANNVVNALVSVILLWRLSLWRPHRSFSWSALWQLFSFGGLMALSYFVETIYSSILSLLLGRWYSPSQLGYYTQAHKLEQVPTSALSNIVSSVSFPLFSQLQDDKTRLRNILRKNITTIMYLNVPLMIMLLVVAKPLIIILYGDKWYTSIEYFQILCLGGAMYTLNSLVLNVIKSLGKSNIYLFVQLLKRLISIGLIFAIFRIAQTGLIDGVRGLIWVVTASFYIYCIINSIFTKRLIDYSLWHQIKDIIPYFLLSTAAALGAYFMKYLVESNMLLLLLQCIVFVIIYLGLSAFLHISAFEEYKIIIKQKFARR